MLCPSCLGVGHLREALSDDSCLHCACIPLAERSARLAMVESTMPRGTLASSASPRKESKRRKRQHAEAPAAKKAHHDPTLSAKVDTLATEFAQIKSLLLSLQPKGQETPTTVSDGITDQSSHTDVDPQSADTMSIAATDSLFTVDDLGYMEDKDKDSPSASVLSSQLSETEPPLESGTGLSFIKQAIQLALSRLGIDNPPTETAPSSVFFKATQKCDFNVPVSQPYIEELHRCWADPRSSTHFSQDLRALSSMHDAAQYGLNRMPSVDSVIASLVVAPADAARPEARCPRPQCRVTDEFLTKSYDIAARIGRLSNSFSHLALALSQSLKEAEVDVATQSLSDASLQTFAYMSRELGRLMSMLTVTRRQVWLAQSPLSESCRTTLRTLPVLPGQVFGPAAQQTLERTVEANKSRQQFADLHRAPRPQPRRATTFRSVTRAPPTTANARAYTPRAQGSERPAFREPAGRAPRHDRFRRAPRGQPPRSAEGRGNRGGRI